MAAVKVVAAVATAEAPVLVADAAFARIAAESKVSVNIKTYLRYIDKLDISKMRRFARV